MTSELRELLAALVTPLPWGNDHGKLYTLARDEGCHGEIDEHEDAALIVAAVNALPALLAVADAAREFVGSPAAALVRDEITALAAAVQRLEEGA